MKIKIIKNMNNLFKKYILGLIMASLVLFLVSVSAQRIEGSVCLTSGNETGTISGGACISTFGGNSGGDFENRPSGSGGQRLPGADLSVIANLIQQIQGLLNLSVPLFIGFAVLYFFYNLIQYFFVNAENATAKSTNVEKMGFGILAIFIMVSLWGIIYFLNAATGIDQGGGAKLPTLPTYQQ